MTRRCSFVTERRTDGCNSRHPPLASGGVANSQHNTEVDVGLGDLVEQFVKVFSGGDGEALHDLAVAEAGGADPSLG